MLGCSLGIGCSLLKFHSLLLLRLLGLLQLLLRAVLFSFQRCKLNVHAHVVLRLLKQICGARKATTGSPRFLEPLPLRFIQRFVVPCLGSFARLDGGFGLPFGLAQPGSVATHRVFALLLQGLQRILTHRATLAHFQ
jgi:hypothetical protein